jgi:hypothetical protein
MRDTSYNDIKKLLIKYPELRSSDKKLLWAVWTISGLTENGSISKEAFYNAPPSETITRARRLVQRDDRKSGKNELQATQEVRAERRKKEKEKGTHAYRVELPKPFGLHKRFEMNEGRNVIVDCTCNLGENH